MSRVRSMPALAAVAVLFPAILVLAGDVTPPAGPVGGTMKTLDEVEARIPVDASTAPGDAGREFWITQPGSYYLTGDITTSRPTGIQISVSNVTLDLNGFTISGGGVSDTGIYLGGSSTITNVTIRNGGLRSFKTGIDAFNGLDCRFEGLVVLDTGFLDPTPSGIAIGVRGAIISHCVASGNDGSGIVASEGSIVVHCIANRNAGTGIDIDAGLVSDCAAIGNATNVAATSGATVVNTHAP